MKSTHRWWFTSFLVVSGCAADEGAGRHMPPSEEVLEDEAVIAEEVQDAPSLADGVRVERDWFLEGATRGEMPIVAFDGMTPQVSSLELSLTPARPYYSPGQIVQLQPVARDAQGQRILGVRFSYTVTPSDAVMRFAGMPGRYELIDEGVVTFEVCANVQLCKAFRLTSDAGSPSLVVEEPQAGAQYGGNGQEELTVRGSVADARGSTVWVGAERVSVDELGRFETSVPAVFGVNRISVTASDGVSADTEVQREVLWAPSYLPTGNIPAATGLRSKLSAAARLSLGQSFFDDKTAPVRNAPPRSEDIADLVTLVVERAQLASLLPNPLVDGGKTLLLRITDVRPQNVSVDVDIVDGGLELFVRIARLEADTQGVIDIEGTSVSLDGGITASLSLFANLRMRVEPGSGVKVELAQFETMLESASSRFAAPAANAVFRLAESALRKTLEDAVRDVLAKELVNQLPRVLEDALQSLAQLLRNRNFTLNFAPLPEQTLAIDGQFAAAALDYGEHVQLGLDVEVGTDHGPLHPGSRGVPQQSARTEVETFDSRALQLALRLDLINLLLHTAWNGGLLEIRGADSNVAGELGDLLKHVTVSGKLPPVLREAHPWEDADAMVELGQLELSFDLGEQSRYGVSVRLPVDVQIQEGALRLSLGSPQVDSWLIESTASTPLSGEELRDLVVPVLLPALDEVLNSRPISLPLPSIPVQDLVRLAPSLSGFELALHPGDDAVVRGNAVVIDLNLVGAVP